MSNIYRVTPSRGVPVLRCAGNIRKATSRGLQEFPAGVLSVELVDLPELARLQTEGVPLPLGARQRLEVHKAIRREQAKADARVQAVREKVRDKAAAERNAKREEERAEKEARKAAEKAEREAQTRRLRAAERRAKRNAGAAQAGAAQAATGATPSVVVDPTDTRLPWED